jgi:hypothetical protein
LIGPLDFNIRKTNLIFRCRFYAATPLDVRRSASAAASPEVSLSRLTATGERQAGGRSK